MGLFDRVRSAISPKMNEQQAVMSIALAAVAADGQIQDQEILRLQAMCMLSPIYAGLSGDQLGGILRQSANLLSQQGQDALAKSAELLTPELRETAFAFATDMVLADGVLGGAEEKFIEDLAKKLNVNEDTAKTIIHVTTIRNRGIK